MSIERARELLGLKGMTDEEVMQQIARDKEEMRQFLKIITRQDLTDN